jgi:(1->4)-alpha-D-glucan 1-alpha-D-glucosylmutase
LLLRRELSDLFRYGTYEPLQATGPHADHVIAFARSWKRQHLIVAISRHFAPLTNGGRHWPKGWDAAIELPADGRYADALGITPGTNAGNTDISTLFATVPFAILHRV